MSKDRSLEKKLTYREHYAETRISRKAGYRSGYIEGWRAGQRAMQNRCLELIRLQCSDHVFMVDRIDAWMESVQDEKILGQHWGAKACYESVSAQGFIEPDHRGEWSDHKPKGRKSGRGAR